MNTAPGRQIPFSMTSSKPIVYQVWELKSDTFITQIPTTNVWIWIEGDDGYPEEEILIQFSSDKHPYAKKKSIQVTLDIPVTVGNLMKIGQAVQKAICERIFNSPLSGMINAKD